MTLDDIKGRTYTSTADFWADLDRLIGTLREELKLAEMQAEACWNEKEALAWDRDQLREERDELYARIDGLLADLRVYRGTEEIDAILAKYEDGR